MTTSRRIPELCAGDVLTRDEFQRSYSAMPHVKKAELIEGVVYMGSPVRHRWHGRHDRGLETWLAHYETVTPGLDSSTNGSVRLDHDNDLQPDILRIPRNAGGASRRTSEGYIEGAPELVIEIAASSPSQDLHQKVDAYRRNGVLEYLIHRVEDGVVDWFVLRGASYEALVSGYGGDPAQRDVSRSCSGCRGLAAGDPASDGQTRTRCVPAAFAGLLGQLMFSGLVAPLLGGALGWWWERGHRSST